MDERLVFEPVEEPRIKSITPEGEEIQYEDENDFLRFLTLWRSVGADPDRLKPEEKTDTADVDRSTTMAWSLMRTVTNADLFYAEALVNSVTTKSEPLELQHTGYMYTEPEEPDLPLGMLVVDKQLQFQAISRLFASTVESLREIVRPFKWKLQQLAEISRKLEFEMIRDFLSGRILPVVKVTCPRSVEIVLDHDKDGNVEWRLARKLFFNVNGVTITGEGLVNPYSRVLVNVALGALFKSMRTDLVKEACRYGVTGVSESFDVEAEGETVHFSQTDHELESGPCPVYLPSMANMMFTINSHPYQRFVQCLASLNRIKTLSKIVIDAFISCDFVEIVREREGRTAVIQLNTVFGIDPRLWRADSSTESDDPLWYPPSGPILVIISESGVTATSAKSPMNLNTIDVSQSNEPLRAWCIEQYWFLFQCMVSTVASRYGFHFTKSNNIFTVRCDNSRIVEFRPAANEEVFVYVSEGYSSFRLTWQSLPLTRSSDKLSYLFFAPLFGN